MSHSIASPPGRRLSFHALALLFLALLVAVLLCHSPFNQAQQLAYFTAHTTGGATFSYEVTTSDLSVDWPGGGDFDPRDKCPEDFFAAGFTVIFKKLPNGNCVKFLWHKGKKLLYRIDKDIIKGKAEVGLHWVESTRFSSKYRIADAAYKGGKAVPVPNSKGGKNLRVFQYGEAVSPKRVQRHRELFQETHINSKQCGEWWDIFNFIP